MSVFELQIKYTFLTNNNSAKSIEKRGFTSSYNKCFHWNANIALELCKSDAANVTRTSSLNSREKNGCCIFLQVFAICYLLC